MEKVMLPDNSTPYPKIPNILQNMELTSLMRIGLHTSSTWHASIYIFWNFATTFFLAHSLPLASFHF
jgi:hypothetical protein